MGGQAAKSFRAPAPAAALIFDGRNRKPIRKSLRKLNCSFRFFFWFVLFEDWFARKTHETKGQFNRH
jgi:hypothetical protein